jgi:hypothetical protein
VSVTNPVQDLNLFLEIEVNIPMPTVMVFPPFEKIALVIMDNTLRHTKKCRSGYWSPNMDRALFASFYYSVFGYG